MTKGIRYNRDALRAICERELAARSSHAWKEPGNKFDHGIRTAKLAERLRTAICYDDPTVNADVLTVAAWFHDLCNGQEDHEAAGAAALPTLIGDLVTEEELCAVCDLVRVHDHRCKDIPLSERLAHYPPSVLLLQDADFLDHLGTYDIWITFSEFAYRKKTPMDYAVQFTDGSFDRFAARWRREINYPLSLEIFEEKIAFEVSFAQRMLRELDGEFR
ncbi:MAG: HD domain-containing protein [Clostridia bacterium]|nr:HD domain-containing protein [Clostridia bacterium]